MPLGQAEVALPGQRREAWLSHPRRPRLRCVGKALCSADLRTTFYKCRKVWDDVSQRAWDAWVRSTAGAGTDWADVETAARKRYKELKGASRGTLDDFVAQTQRTYEEATASPSWWESFTDRVSCAWGDIKCRVADTMHISGAHRGEKTPEQVAGEAHGKVDELYKTAKSEL